MSLKNKISALDTKVLVKINDEYTEWLATGFLSDDTMYRKLLDESAPGSGECWRSGFHCVIILVTRELVRRYISMEGIGKAPEKIKVDTVEFNDGRGDVIIRGYSDVVLSEDWISWILPNETFRIPTASIKYVTTTIE